MGCAETFVMRLPALTIPESKAGQARGEQQLRKT